jgi:hypothetical protein
VAAIDNAEAVPLGDLPKSTSSADIAGAAVGVGATEASRRQLDPATERALVVAEVSSLVEAEQMYAAAGDPARASSAAAGADVLRQVLRGAAEGRP